jgi:hypothetical protein
MISYGPPRPSALFIEPGLEYAKREPMNQRMIGVILKPVDMRTDLRPGEPVTDVFARDPKLLGYLSRG